MHKYTAPWTSFLHSILQFPFATEKFNMLRQILVLSLLGLSLAAPSAKINSDLARALERSRLVNIFVQFHGGNARSIQKASLSTFATRGEKITHLVEILKTDAAATQQNAISILSALPAYSPVSHEQFWMTNELYVKNADAALVNKLSALAEVSEIHEEDVFPVPEVFHEKDSGIAPNAEWGIAKIQAEQAWALPGGNNGQGVVVGTLNLNFYFLSYKILFFLTNF